MRPRPAPPARGPALAQVSGSAPDQVSGSALVRLPTCPSGGPGCGRLRRWEACWGTGVAAREACAGPRRLSGLQPGNRDQTKSPPGAQALWVPLEDGVTDAGGASEAPREVGIMGFQTFGFSIQKR